MSNVVPDDLQKMLADQNRYFNSGETRSIDFRLAQLKKLKSAMKSMENELLDALWEDLHKSKNEAYTTEIGMLYSSINDAIKNLRKWAKPKRVGASLMLIGTTSRIYREPYGTVLVISPFNYPVNLVFEPVIGAIAAGNCIVIKPSEMTPNVTAVICQLVEKTFDQEYMRVVQGGREVTEALVGLPFDYIFFTGGEKAGKAVMKAAAENLIPVTLELGGKSPCIVDETADVEAAARKITWGKFTNAGQTCVAPDYLVVHNKVQDRLVTCIQESINNFYGDDPEKSADLGRIINEDHTARIAQLIDASRVISGGKIDLQGRYIAPTLMRSSWDAEEMQEELFGPLLPVLEFDDFNKVVSEIKKKPKPLALYIYSKDKQRVRKVLNEVSFGGGCINDIMLHAGNPGLPFGGVGASGIGSYHGRRSYETFSHEKGILNRLLNVESNAMYPPYNDKKLSTIKMMLK